MSSNGTLLANPQYLRGYHEGHDVMVPLFDGSATTVADSILADLVVGVDANEVPLNSMLGTMAYQSEEAINVGIAEADELRLDKTISAVTGSQTISKPAGSFLIAAGAGTATITNTLVTANSVILLTIGSNDTTLKSAVAVAESGSFVVTANANATADCRVNFLVVN